MFDAALAFALDNLSISALIVSLSTVLGIYAGIKIIGKDVWWLLRQICQLRPPVTKITTAGYQVWIWIGDAANETKTKGLQTGSLLSFRYIRRGTMHLKFDGNLKAILTNQDLPDKRVHAAFLSVELQAQMDIYVDGGNTGMLTVAQRMANAIKEARSIDQVAYRVWVAKIAADLILHPEKHAIEGYTVPWTGVSEPFLKSIWTKGDPETPEPPAPRH